MERKMKLLSEDWQPSTRRSTGPTEAFRTYEGSLIDSSRTYYTPLSTARISPRERSDSPPVSAVAASTLRTFQYRIRVLESENRDLKRTIRGLEDRAKAENDSWKRKLRSEIAISKSRELDLISRFNAVERLVKAQEMQGKETGLLYKNSETALLIRLDQTNADAEALEAKLEAVTKEVEEMKAEKAKLEQNSEERAEELEATRQELLVLAEELKKVYGEVGKLRVQREIYPNSDLHSVEGENRLASYQASPPIDDLNPMPQTAAEPFLLRYLRDPPPAPRPLRTAFSPLLQVSEPSAPIPFGPVLSTSCPRVNFPPFTR